MCDEGKRGLLESWLAREGREGENKRKPNLQVPPTFQNPHQDPNHSTKFHTELLPPPLLIPASACELLSILGNARTFEYS